VIAGPRDDLSRALDSFARLVDDDPVKLRMSCAMGMTLVACGPDGATASAGGDGADSSGRDEAGAIETGTAATTIDPSTDDGGPACVPGQSIACACTDGSMGAQVCVADGSGYEPCVCDDDTTTGLDTGSTGVADTTGGSVDCLPDDEPYPGNFAIDSPDDIAEIAPYSVIAGSLQIQGAAITSLEGLECVRFIGNQIYLGDTTLLHDFTGLDNVEIVQGEIEIGHNQGLQSFVGLSSLTSAGWLSLYDNAQLASFAGLDALTSIQQGFSVNGNTSLANCTVAEFIAGLEQAPANICVQDNLADECPDDCN